MGLEGKGSGGEGEGIGVKGGGKWGLGTPLSTPSKKLISRQKNMENYPVSKENNASENVIC